MSHYQKTNTNTNLWIGELETWMDENYITKCLDYYSKIH